MLNLNLYKDYHESSVYMVKEYKRYVESSELSTILQDIIRVTDKSCGSELFDQMSRFGYLTHNEIEEFKPWIKDSLHHVLINNIMEIDDATFLYLFNKIYEVNKETNKLVNTTGVRLLTVDKIDDEYGEILDDVIVTENNNVIIPIVSVKVVNRGIVFDGNPTQFSKDVDSSNKNFKVIRIPKKPKSMLVTTFKQVVEMTLSGFGYKEVTNFLNLNQTKGVIDTNKESIIYVINSLHPLLKLGIVVVGWNKNDTSILTEIRK